MKVISIQKLALKKKLPISKLAISESLETLAIVQNNSEGGSTLSIIDEFTQEVIFTNSYYQAALNSISFINDNILCLIKNNSTINLINYKSSENIASFVIDNKISSVKAYNELLLIGGKRMEIWNWKQQKILWLLDNYISGTITENWSYENLDCDWEYSDYLKKQPFINLPASGILNKEKKEILICGNNSAKIILFSWVDNKVIKEVLNAPLQISNLTVSKTRKYFLTSGKIPDGEFLWKGKSYNRHLENLFNEHFRASNISEFHPNEKSLARGFLNGHVIINKLCDGEVLFMEKLHSGEVTGLCYNKTGDTLYSSGIDGEVSIINFEF